MNDDFKFRPIPDSELIEAVDNWLRFRQPVMATKKELKEIEALDQEYRFRLANKAAEWAYTRREALK